MQDLVQVLAHLVQAILAQAVVDQAILAQVVEVVLLAQAEVVRQEAVAHLEVEVEVDNKLLEITI